ncbi:CHAT domain-containing protein [Dendryphion nanum]|uniref:CHAT domain-containing protein n=1 Tax=Dendryphion nanum TaxID=256645 RepID=A0A9P9DCN5_9PLEO|nr:CHAT domain-containing protein [Dendryphion nanum]
MIQLEQVTANMEELRTRIRTFTGLGQFKEGRDFVESLPPEVQKDKSVAFDIIELYLVQGHYRLAEQALENCLHETTGSNNERAALDLLGAFLGISRHSLLFTALEKATERGDELNIRDGFVPDWGTTDITESRTLAYFYYWKIVMVAAEQGLLDVKAIKMQCIAHLTPLRHHLQGQGRIREARRFIYLEVYLINNPNEAIQELEAYLRLCQDERYAIQRAMTLVDLGTFQLKSEDSIVLAKADDAFSTAENLFRNLEHQYGSIDIAATKLEYDRTIGSGEKFLRKVELANQYFAVNHFQNGIRTLAFAVTPHLAIDIYAEDVAKALEVIDKKIEEVGGEILKQLSMLHSISHAASKGREAGFALHALETYFAHPPIQTGPVNKSGFASMLSITYSNLGQSLKALQMAEEAFNIAQLSRLHDTASDAAMLLAHTNIVLAREIAHQDLEKSRQLRYKALAVLKSWIEKDNQNGYTEGVVQKSLSFAELLAEDDENLEQPYIDRVKTLIPDTASFMDRKELMSLQMRTAQQRGRYNESFHISLEYLQAAREGTTTPAVKAEAYLSASCQGFLLAMANLRREGASEEDFSTTISLLKTSLQAATQAIQIHHEITGSVELALESAIQMWRIIKVLLPTFADDEARRAIIVGFLEEVLSTVEKSCDEMRRSIVPLHGLDSLLNKRHVVSKRVSVSLYGLGTALAAYIGDNTATWMWLQRGKARAFLDSLGSKVAIPERKIKALSINQDAMKLFREENDLLELQQDPKVDQVLIARKLVELRRAMKDHSLLNEITRVKDAMLMIEHDFKELRKALKQTNIEPGKVKFVDWLIPSTAWSAGLDLAEIIILIKTIDGAVVAYPLSIAVKDVEEWITLAFKFPELSEPPLSKKTGNRLLQRMRRLIEGLEIHTSKDDLLVLSPTGLLSQVPIHALEIDKTPLAERNMLVYASTVATMYSSVQRWAESKTEELLSSPRAVEVKNKAFMGVYEDMTMPTERSAIFSNIKEIASSWDNASTVLGPEVSKEKFANLCSKSSWLHYHGHARYGMDDVCASSLVLSDGVDLFDGNPLPDEQSDGLLAGTAELTVRDIFALQMPLGAVHLTVIACDSGTQDLAPGNEPLGIIPAMLYAGATSVVGCLWPIESRAGRAFSEAFYDHLRGQRQQREQMQGVEEFTGAVNQGLNLALAVSSAVGRMRRGELGPEFKQAYYWAPFVLHGLWFFD